jgi:predicted anti-sigma-YlaC factor YlaD
MLTRMRGIVRARTSGNQDVRAGDLQHVGDVGSCDRWREALSARADGEVPGVDDRLIDAHVARCPACRAFAANADLTRRRLLVREASAMPDLSHRVSRLNAIADRASGWSVVRALLAVVGVEVIAFAIPELVLGHGDANAHAARHLGAFSVAYGIALLVVVVRPARARTVLPVSAFLAAALVITSTVDLLAGRAPWNAEIGHLPEVISVALVWLIAVPVHRPHGRRAPVAGRDRHATQAVLRLVGTDDADGGSVESG